MGRLLDIRFLSVDFLNTFLITYRVFTSATSLLDTLLQFYYANNANDYACVDLVSPTSRKTRSVSLPGTESLNAQRALKGNHLIGHVSKRAGTGTTRIVWSDSSKPLVKVPLKVTLTEEEIHGASGFLGNL